MRKCCCLGRRTRMVGVMLFAVCSAGCAMTGTSAYRYTPPVKSSVQNELLVPRTFDSVWDALVRELSKSFFVINNIDKASRLINLSFSTDRPEDFIDCGSSHRTYDREGEHTVYDYQTCASMNYKIASKGGAFENLAVTQHLNRRTDLEGRINIVVTPQGESTSVAVNCKYVFSAHLSGSWVAENILGVESQRGTIDPITRSLSFLTTQSQSADWGTSAAPNIVTCQSAGKLEKQILDMVHQ